MSGQRQLVGIGEVLTFIYTLPLALVGLTWLVIITDWRILRSHGGYLLLFLVLMLIFSRLSFFMITEVRKGRYATYDGSLETLFLWTALFLYGPSALWISIIKSDFEFGLYIRQPGSKMERWTSVRNFTHSLAVNTLGAILALMFYQRSGGIFPLHGLDAQAIPLAFAALVIYFIVQLIIWSGYFVYSVWVQTYLAGRESVSPMLKFLFLAMGLQNLSNPFAILAAGLFTQHGPATFLFFTIGMLLVAYLARRLSWAAEGNRQRARQLDRLEDLSRAILNSSPDTSELPRLLQEYVPAMFPAGRMAIWLSKDGFLLRHPEEWSIDSEPFWEWIYSQEAGRVFLKREKLPWEVEGGEHNALVVAPVLEVEIGEPIGFIYLEVFSLVQPWDTQALFNLLPAVHSLAAQIASALNSRQVYQQHLAYQKITEELALAGRIQASFLPNELPVVNGWELAMTLRPARETSGDFFDLIPLSNGRLGILIADVTDKGVGAALYMALSRTLIRTYAIEYDENEPQPELVLYATNNRILQDARANLFVTAFYAILDPTSGIFTYCNAGHNPPYLLNHAGEDGIQALRSTGIPIGIDEDTLWVTETIQISPGEVIVLYTDGIPDAQNILGQFYEEKRLVEVACANLGRSAQDVQDAILMDFEEFVGEAAQFDDITLIVLMRNSEQGSSLPV